ncbi:MAG TPA: glycine cleavage system protein GcvH [Longimicrobiales bacterium]|nr:glycine cleavage system protein GcvH [Longimicrobiales bacterium]
MSEIPQDLLYTEEHEYLMPTEQANVYQVGITDYAQGELGDIVYVELPSPGDKFGRMEVFGTVEAVKAVSDLYSPVAGTVIEVNESLHGDPSLVNSDPYGDGWLIKIRVANPSALDELLGAKEYAAHLGE